MQIPSRNFFWLLAIAGVLFLQGCQDKCKETVTYTAYIPVFMTYDELRDAVASEAPRDLKNPGKIFIKGDILLVNELMKGVHIIDNSNPANPVPVSFINIPGNVDIALRGNYLYADSYMDLVTIDITDPTNAVEVDRELDALPPNTAIWPDSGVVVDYREEVITQTMDCNGFYYPEVIMFDQSFGGLTNAGGPRQVSSTSGGSEMPGLGGSMARFSLVNDYLYLIDMRDLHAYDVSTSSNPELRSTQDVGFNIETLWHYNLNLFIGATNGMYIYELNDPANPDYASFYGHVNSCDPVVVSNDIAYVTLRSGTQCQGFTNQLEVIDVSNIFNPTVLHVFPMHNPHGLGVDNNVLFICDNDQGLKVFDATDLSLIGQKMIDHITNITTYDVIPIPWTKQLILTGPDGIYQFDYTNPADLIQLSHLPVVP